MLDASEGAYNSRTGPFILLLHVLQELLVITIIVALVVRGGSQHHANGARGKVVYLSPDHRTDVKAVVRSIEMKSFLLTAIVQSDIETAGHGDNDLLESLMPMPRPRRSPRHVIQVVDALDFEWNVLAVLNKGQVSSRV